MEELLTVPKMNDESFANIVDHANHLLLYKQFEECISWCHKGSWKAKAFSENNRSHHVCEALSLVALQAYAELDRWQEALPFINQMYQSIENFPTSVVDACVRLHASVEDYMTCAAMCSVWLRHPNNLEKPDYCTLVETFVDCVLVIQKRWQDVKPFLESCPGLDGNKKKNYLKQTEKLKHHSERQCVDKIEALPTEADPSTADETCTSNADTSYVDYGRTHATLQTLTNHFKKIISNIYHHLYIPSNPVVKNAALCIMVLYILLSRKNFGMMSYGWWYKACGVLLRVWRAMFSPFYLAKQ